MDLIARGILKSFEETVVISEKFKKREFVLETVESYPQKIKFELVNTFVDYINQFKIGEEIELTFSIRGNEYQGKVYNNLRVVSMSKPNGAGAPVQENATTQQTNTAVANAKPANAMDFDDDDLPF